jgi:4-methyl-5(b-hydroxyethyl)-thiazole monophosphate biosynthesis
MSKVSVLLADGFEEVEGLTVVDLLRRAGIEVETVSIMETRRVIGRSRIQIKADTDLEEAEFGDVDMIVLPGGQPGTTYLGQSEKVKKLLLKFAEKGKQIAAICAAPTVLGSLGLLKGRRAACYPGCEDQLVGAEVVLDQEVVVDGNITTSRGAGTAIAFSLQLIENLLDAEAAENVGRGIVYKTTI